MPMRVKSYVPRRSRSRMDQRRSHDKLRQEDRSFYWSTRWRKLRKAHLSAEPLCRECLVKGITMAAAIVDHIQDRKARPDLALDDSNLQSLCKRCHDQKTATMHGFGS